MTGDAVRYTPGRTEVDDEGVTWLVVDAGGYLVWLSQDGDVHPIGGGPEVLAGERSPALARVGRGGVPR